jgi:hypothetical protein
MKTNFKKLASSAAVTAALAAGSMSAHAVITSVPGEAFLVPFAVANNADTAAKSGYGLLDTVVRIVVPASTGLDSVFAFTAPHTSPTNPVAGGGATELPDQFVDGEGTHIHWYFLNAKSEHILDGTMDVTPDDVDVFDWGQVVSQNPSLANQVGYLVFVTNKGADGLAANFNFFADAYFVTHAERFDPQNPDAGGDVFSSVNIPALPLADGADGDATAPTLDNNVLEPWSQDVRVSPLVSGIRTSIVDGKNQFTIVDLELASGVSNPFGEYVQDVNSMLVIWNDRNAVNWGGLGVDVFDAHEQSCSWRLAAPKELNLIWVPNGGPFGETVSNPEYARPSFANVKANTGSDTGAQVAVNGLCTPNAYVGPDASFVGNRLDGGFVKFRLPEPKATATSPESASAAAAFTINFTGWYQGGEFMQGFAAETVLGHDRGKFTGK